MDLDLDDLLSIDNVKTSTKFQPKAKPKPKPKPKPNPKTQPEPIPTPAPPTPILEAAVNGRTEEQPVDNHQISGHINDDCQSYEKQQEDNAESNLESLNDFLPQSTTVTVNSVPCSESETPTIHVSIEPDLVTNLVDPLTGEPGAIFNDNQDFQMGNLSSLSKDDESSLLWESLDVLSESRTVAGPKVGKFKPKPKVQTHKVATSNQYEENIHSVLSQNDYMENDPLPSFTPDEILGSSSVRISDSVPTESISDFHLNQEPIELAESSQVDFVGSVPETPSVGPESAKKGKKQMNEAGGRSRRQSKKTLALVDEIEDVGIADENQDNNNNNDNDNNNNDDYVPENDKKKGSKAKTPVNEKEKPVRKRKKSNDAPDESTKVTKKKFTHSTRRNKRQVNPELLKIPEDELEFHMHTIPMKELIRLAEHKERIAKKEASTSGTPALNQSGKSFSNHYDEDEGFGNGSNEHDHSMEGENATYYNYRTHMKITPRMKWTKQDTELFYEAVQQFGTDLEMIKECFPGRTRQQIKSKYKKEERQQPLRLNDALTTRFKGHSHFEEVIERLKQAQGEDSENNEPIGEAEEGVAADTNEGGEETKEEEDVPPAVGSPTKSNESEDDMFRWSQYKSEI